MWCSDDDGHIARVVFDIILRAEIGVARLICLGKGEVCIEKLSNKGEKKVIFHFNFKNKAFVNFSTKMVITFEFP
jgi:hypothetical protein